MILNHNLIYRDGYIAGYIDGYICLVITCAATENEKYSSQLQNSKQMS